MKDVEVTKGHFKSFDGTEIYYESRGSGEPIIFAYGIGCLINHWTHQIKYFSQNYQTIVFDYRAHHKSQIPENEDYLTMDCLAKDIVALADHLKLEKLHFCGHSFGVPVLINTYKHAPQLFKSLILLNGFITNPFTGMFGTDISQHLFNLLKSAQGSLPDTTNYIWEKILDNQISPIILSLAGGFNINLTEFKDIEAYTHGLASLELKPLITLFENMTEFDGTEISQNIDCPSLILGGTKDLVTPLKHQIKIHELIDGSEFSKIPYATHCSQLDLPELVNLKIEKFVENYK